MSDVPQSVITEGFPKEAQKELKVSLSYGEMKLEFSGNSEGVLQSINSFLMKSIPALSLAHKVSLSYDTKELIERFQDYVRITPEGPRVIANGLSDKHNLALQLIAQRIAFDVGSAPSALLSLAEIQDITGLKPKSISSRLSELSKDGLVVRETKGTEGSGFKISTLGIKWFLDSIVKKKPAVKS